MTDVLEHDDMALPMSRKERRQQRRLERARRFRTLRRSTWIVLFIACLAGVPVLTLIAIHAIRYSDSGRFVTPNQKVIRILPNTPASLVVHIGADGKPVSIAVLAVGATGTGGDVMLVPLATLAGDQTGAAPHRLTEVFATGGTAAVAQQLATLFQVRFTTVAEITNAQWTDVSHAVGPVTVTNPDTIKSADGSKTFLKGSLQLDGADLGDYLDARFANETELSRLIRTKAVWQALLASGATATTSTTPGATTTARKASTTAPASTTAVSATPAVDVGSLITAIGHGTSGVIDFPFDDKSAKVEAFAPRVTDIREFAARVMPGAIVLESVSGIRVRLQNGSGDPKLVGTMIDRLTKVGATVVFVTDIDPASISITEVQWYRAENQGHADDIQRAIGAGNAVSGTDPIEGIDISVILAADAKTANPANG